MLYCEMFEIVIKKQLVFSRVCFAKDAGSRRLLLHFDENNYNTSHTKLMYVLNLYQNRCLNDK